MGVPLDNEVTMTARAKASRENRLWPGSPVEGETVEALKRSCPGPGPGITKCLSLTSSGWVGRGEGRGFS